ncbi:hypothetical protein AAH013_14060 [Phocaeicola dorei]|uniref:hypothetical protein n=1 Tax=Phocaeicola dorei TaxID=357276 RepID=UPI0039B57835
MTETFVTLETAKMLKEKGFMEDCMAFYTKNVLFKCNAYINTNVLKLPAPTQSIAQKWLRETKNIHICVYNCACGYGYEISKADNGTHITSSVYEGTNDGGEWDTYEEVLETGLQEALKLI